MTPSQRVRVGVALGSRCPPAWIQRLLAGIVESEFSRLEVAVVVQARGSSSAVGNGGWPLRLMEALDARLLATSPDALRRPDLSSVLPNLRLENTAVTAEAALILSGHELDVVLALDTEPGGLEQCAVHGVWSVVFGDPHVDDGSPAYFWELHDRCPVVGAVIRADDAAGSRILYRSHSATEPVSLHRNRSAAAWKTGRALLLRLQELHSFGLDSLLGHAEEMEAAANPAGERAIRLSNVARVSFGMARSGLARFLDWRLRRGEWFVAYRKQPGWPPWRGTAPYRLLESPRGRFLADPFLLERDGRHVLFVEDFVRSRGKAVISWVELGTDGAMGDPQTALERDYHLSYPFVFEWEGDVYMIPETAAAKRVELYRADPFPNRWTLVRVLLSDVVADDATLLQHDGRFWLFVSIAPDGASPVHGEIFLFSSELLGSDWLPHPWNPVVTDVRSGRPAGSIFAHGGSWIRPAQDCSSRYGYATVFNQIEVLTRRAYRERPVARLGPEWLQGNLATHSYSRDSTYETVDGYRQYRRRPYRERRA